MTRRALFPYSGSKARVLQHLPAPPAGTTHICEPFAGSLAYSTAHRPAQVTCAEASPLVRGLLQYLHTADPVRLRWIASLPIERVDIAAFGEQHGLTAPEQTLVRLFTSGAYKGQLNSRVLYPQHRMRLDEETLAWFRDTGLTIHDDFRACTAPDAWWFVDPPYLDTHAGYDRSVGKLHVQDVMQVMRGRHGLATYHEPTAFPELQWQVACVRKVPNMRKGGTTDRVEYYARLHDCA